MSVQLRPYQAEIIQSVRSLMQNGKKRILITAPTGSGKTLLTAYMLKAAISKGFEAWFINHRRELIKQSAKTFHFAGISHGIIAAGFPEDKRSRIQIAAIQTLAKRFTRLRPPKLIVWDECHHIAAGSWAKIHSTFPGAFHIGLTATPERLDGKGLDAWFDELVQGPSVAWLIENGFLAPYRLYAPAGIVTQNIRTIAGDFAKDDLAKAADKPTITGDAIKHYFKHAQGKRAVVFCVSIEHSKHVVEQFRAAGVAAAHVDGETNVDERDAAIRRFERGEISVLSNVELFGEGFDLPAIEVAILLRPTQSLGLYLQQCGRALRPCEGKPEAIILDHAGNCQRHGLPDEERGWSLAGRKARGNKKDGDGPSVSVRVCPRCFAAQFSGRPMCGNCGYTFPIESRQVEQVEGDLKEVDPTQVRRERLKEQGIAQTFDELVAIGRQRHYRRPELWARHLLNARMRKYALR